MPHIKLPDRVPGILGPLLAYRESAKYLNGLAQTLMRGPSSLTVAERELIATFVSLRNECEFCANSHAAAARQLLGDDNGLIDEIMSNISRAPIDEKLRALLLIADKVRYDGRFVTDADVKRARREGADDKAIHDTVLIAAMFCMFNRYVDGLATSTPKDSAAYQEIGNQLVTEGYGGHSADYQLHE